MKTLLGKGIIVIPAYNESETLAEVVVLLGLKKFKVSEVPVDFRERKGGRSMYSSLGTVLYSPFKSILSSFIVLLRVIQEQGRR